MRASLIAHPDTPSTAIAGIDVDVARLGADTLSLLYTVRGRIDDLRLAPVAAPARTDGLWQTTCFEAFVQTLDGAYAEFNFAPSTQWAAYQFIHYRAGMADAEIAAPLIETQTNADLFTLNAVIIRPWPPGARLALSAVIEETSGAKSYWAAAHAPGKPDFHHAESFILDLPLAERP